MLAIACGVIVANIYYAQPLAGPIGEALGLSVGATGLIVTLTQIGYGLGLLFVVPLGDLVETRALVVSALGVCMASLLVAATSKRATEFLVASLIIGVSSTAVQVLVPFAASLAPLYLRGRVVGAVMSGLLLGIMLARPVASFLDDLRRALALSHYDRIPSSGWHRMARYSTHFSHLTHLIWGPTP